MRLYCGTCKGWLKNIKFEDGSSYRFMPCSGRNKFQFVSCLDVFCVLIALISPFLGGKSVIVFCFFVFFFQRLYYCLCGNRCIIQIVVLSMLAVPVLPVALMVDIIAVLLERLFKYSFLRWRVKCIFSDCGERDLRKYKPARE